MGRSEATERVRTAASAVGLELEVVEYPDGTRTAEDAAAAVGCAVDQIVKSMVFRLTTDGVDELVLVLTSGANQVDTDALTAAAGAHACGRADADAVREATGYAIGGVPPFGHDTRLRTWVDPHLHTFEVVWAAAGTPRHVFPIAPDDLVTVTGAVAADVVR